MSEYRTVEGDGIPSLAELESALRSASSDGDNAASGLAAARLIAMKVRLRTVAPDLVSGGPAVEAAVRLLVSMRMSSEAVALAGEWLQLTKDVLQARRGDPRADPLVPRVHAEVLSSIARSAAGDSRKALAQARLAITLLVDSCGEEGLASFVLCDEVGRLGELYCAALEAALAAVRGVSTGHDNFRHVQQALGAHLADDAHTFLTVNSGLPSYARTAGLTDELLMFLETQGSEDARRRAEDISARLGIWTALARRAPR